MNAGHLHKIAERYVIEALSLLIMASAVLLAPTAQASSSAESGALIITLDEALERAFARSPLIGAGQAAIQAAEARQDAARARFFPDISLLARYSRLSYAEPGTISLPIQLPGVDADSGQSIGEPFQNQTQLRLSFEQPLFTGFALLRAKDIAAAATQLASVEQRVSQAELRLRVEEAYIGLLGAQAHMALLDESLATLQAREEQAQALLNAGRVTELDLLRIQSQRMTVESSIERALRLQEVARQALAVVIGVDQAQAFTLAPLGSVNYLLDVTPEPPELELARQAEELRDLQASLPLSNYYPRVALTGGAMVANPNERFFPPQTRWNGSWDLSIVLNWTFDSLVNHHEARARRYEQVEAQERARAVAEQSALEVMQHQGKLQSNLDILDALQQVVAVNQRALEDAEALFSVGRLSMADVLERQVDLQRAQAEVIDAELAAHRAAAHLRRWQGR